MHHLVLPTLSRGISLSSDPCLRNTFPAVCWGLMPIPSSVIIADVAGGTLNSSAANFNTAVNGVLSGTLNHLNPIAFSTSLHITPFGCVLTSHILSYTTSEIADGLFINVFVAFRRCS